MQVAAYEANIIRNSRQLLRADHKPQVMLERCRALSFAPAEGLKLKGHGFIATELHVYIHMVYTCMDVRVCIHIHVYIYIYICMYMYM